jgi:hypothetical protein
MMESQSSVVSGVEEGVRHRCYQASARIGAPFNNQHDNGCYQAAALKAERRGHADNGPISRQRRRPPAVIRNPSQKETSQPDLNVKKTRCEVA